MDNVLEISMILLQTELTELVDQSQQLDLTLKTRVQLETTPRSSLLSQELLL